MVKLLAFYKRCLYHVTDWQYSLIDLWLCELYFDQEILLHASLAVW